MHRAWLLSVAGNLFTKGYWRTMQMLIERDAELPVVTRKTGVKSTPDQTELFPSFICLQKSKTIGERRLHIVFE